MYDSNKRRVVDAAMWTFMVMFLVLILMHQAHSRSLPGSSAKVPAASVSSRLSGKDASGVVALSCDRKKRVKVARLPPPPAYVSACGDCHLAFPARMLPAASWQALLAGLDRHFGSDASLSPAELLPVRAYLMGAARAARDTDPATPELRIIDTRWWQRQHHGIRAARWQHPSIASRSACDACHINAATTGSFGRVRVPRAGQP
jgi:hypothetical protein